MPYFFNPSFSFKLKVSSIFGGFVFIFLYIFKPFYISFFTDIILEYTFGIGFITFLGIFILLTVSPLIFKEFFREDKWTLGKNILFIYIGIILISIAIFFWGENYKASYSYKKLSLAHYLLYTSLVAIIPCIFYISFNEQLTRKRRNLKAKKIISEIQDVKPIDTFVKIFAQNNKESIKFHLSDLLYISCQANYASFFLIKKNKTREVILRTTLTKINENLAEFPQIVRCHKSYIVNTKFVEYVSGNARGYLLHLQGIKYKVPVSRSFSKQSLDSLLA